jgi:hypothetical protein
MKDDKVFDGFLKYNKNNQDLTEKNRSATQDLNNAEEREKSSLLLFANIFSCVLCFLNLKYNVVNFDYFYLIPVLLLIASSVISDSSASGIISGLSMISVGLYAISPTTTSFWIFATGILLSLILNVMYRHNIKKEILTCESKSFKAYKDLNDNQNLYNTALNHSFSIEFIKEKIITLPESKVNDCFKEHVVKRYNQMHSTDLSF